jgi:elongation factor 3
VFRPFAGCGADSHRIIHAITAGEFKGGVVIISHNRDFTQEICPETWTIANNRITVEGAEWMAAVEQARKREEKEAAKRIPKEEETKYDSFGNIIVEDKAPKELDRKQRKVLEKKRKEMIKNGEDTFDIDTLLGL